MPDNAAHGKDPVPSESVPPQTSPEPPQAGEGAARNDNYDYNETKAVWQQPPPGGYYDPYQGNGPDPYAYNGQPLPVMRGSGLSIAGFVLGIVGFLFAVQSWISPFLFGRGSVPYGAPVIGASGMVAFFCSIITVVLGIIGTILSILGIIKSGKKPLAIIGLILSLLAFGAALVIMILCFCYF